jgi:hypothetical protein
MCRPLKINYPQLVQILSNLLLTIGLCSLFSCSSVVTIQKRLYRKGYTVSAQAQTCQLSIPQKKLNLKHLGDRDEMVHVVNTYANSQDTINTEIAVATGKPLEVSLNPNISTSLIAKRPVELQKKGMSIKRPSPHIKSFTKTQLAEPRKKPFKKMDYEDVLFWIGFILLFGGLILMLIWVNGDMDFDALAIMWIICYSLGFGLLSAMI